MLHAQSVQVPRMISQDIKQALVREGGREGGRGRGGVGERERPRYPDLSRGVSGYCFCRASKVHLRLLCVCHAHFTLNVDVRMRLHEPEL